MKKLPKFILSEKVEEVSPYEFESNLGSIASMVEGWIQKYGLDARIDWNPDYWFQHDTSPSPRFFIIVNREETDKEYELRIGEYELAKNIQIEKDLAELRRLKSIYKDVE